MVVQWFSRPHWPGFDAQAMHSFLVLFHLIKVVLVRLRIFSCFVVSGFSTCHTVTMISFHFEALSSQAMFS